MREEESVGDLRKGEGAGAGEGEEPRAVWSCAEGNGVGGARRSERKEEESDYTEGLRVRSGKG